MRSYRQSCIKHGRWIVIQRSDGSRDERSCPECSKPIKFGAGRGSNTEGAGARNTRPTFADPTSKTTHTPDYAKLAAEEAARVLGEALADELHIAAVKVENALEDRDEAIRQAWRLGLSAVAIGQAVGLSRQRVYQIAKAE
jgi:hypothetical protein